MEKHKLWCLCQAWLAYHPPRMSCQWSPLVGNDCHRWARDNTLCYVSTSKHCTNVNYDKECLAWNLTYIVVIQRINWPGRGSRVLLSQRKCLVKNIFPCFLKQRLIIQGRFFQSQFFTRFWKEKAHYLIPLCLISKQS